MGRAIRLVLLAAPLAGGLPAQEPVPVGPLSRVEVTAIEFPGARSLERGLLLDAIATRPTSCGSPLFFPACVLGDWDWAQDRGWLDPSRVAEDRERLELLYESWGYPDARVTASYDTAAETTVRFRVREGDPILVESLAVQGRDRFDPPIELPPRLPLRPSDPYALPHLAMVEGWLRDRMAERGHPLGTVDISGAVDEADRTARLVLTLEPGPAAVFGPARIDAADPIDEEVVRATLTFEPGDPYTLESLYRSERALYKLPIVRRVVIQPAVALPPAGDSAAVPVDVRVVPRDQRGTALEGTLSSTECLTLAGFWRDRYFLGGPRLLGVGVGLTHLGAGPIGGRFPCTSTGTGRYADPQYFAEAALRQPWPGWPETQLELRLSASRSAAPDVYVLESYGARLALSHTFARDLVGTVGYAPARNTLTASAAYFCGSYGVCAEDAIDALEGTRWLAPVEASVAWIPSGEPRQTIPPDELADRALWGPLDSRYWVRAAVEAGGGWSASDWSYARTIAEASVTRPLGTRNEVAGHIRTGVVTGSDVLPPFLRLYSGGLYSVRGFAQNMLGPATLVTSVASAAELGCDPACPAGLTVGPDPVSIRPTGGDRLIEGSIEARRWLADIVQVAAFVDVGALGRGTLILGDDGAGRDAGESALPGGWTTRLTPGIGVRVLSNLGPIRLDVGYDPSGPRILPLLAAVESGGLDYLGRVRFDPFGHGDASGLTELVRRLEIHVGIGQAF